jgi:hypothetical protein
MITILGISTSGVGEDRLEILAARERRTMNEMIAEALEDLFNKHTAD